MIALVPRHGTKNPIFGVLAHGLLRLLKHDYCKLNKGMDYKTCQNQYQKAGWR